VYIAVLNWNGWGETIACLESVLRSDYADFRVVVCDNGSTDGSLEHLRAWLDGDLEAIPPAHPRVARHLRPPLRKPLDYQELSRDEAEQGAPTGRNAPLVLIRNDANLGYAGGNNVALRYAMACGDADYVWVLNNDVIVAPEALARVVSRADRDPGIGLCGSTLLDMDDPDRVQALGGASFNPWLGTHRHLGAGRRDIPLNGKAVERRMHYVVGASVLVSRDWLHRVGLLCEDYFLYFEEIDWAVRGRGRMRLGYAPGSHVYHHQGASAGSPAAAAATDCLAIRNRLMFARKRLPWAVPTVWLGLLGVLVNRIRRGQVDRVKPIVEIMFGRSRAA
jgi:GT2 family glycosyltransferase